MTQARRISFVKTAAFLAAAAAAAGLIIFSKDAGDSARDGLILCGRVVIPALFPFFVVSSFAIELGAAEYAGMIMERFMRTLFNVSGVCAPAFALGLFGGYPVGAKTAVSLYERGACSKSEAEQLLAFCNNSGPAFILGAVGAGILKDGKAGIILYSAHIMAAVTTGIIFRFRGAKEKPVPSESRRVHIQSKRLSEAFISSVQSGLKSVLNISAFVVVFSVVIRLLYLFKIIPAASDILSPLFEVIGATHSDAEHFLTGLIEVTSGLWAMSSSATNIATKLALASFMLGWAGISVHFQAMSFIKSTDLSVKPYFCGKAISAVCASIYTMLLTAIFPFPVSAGSGFTDYSTLANLLTFPNIMLFSLFVCTLIWIALIVLSAAARKIQR